MEDNAFQFDELVDPYRVASSNDLEDNSKFHVGENTFIDIEVEELNDILRNSRHTEVNEDDDSDEINI
jgi:transcription initiation factor TFIID subunit TAF12